MSIKKETQKLGQKIENLGQDKEQRAAECFNIIKSNNIKLVDAKTGVELTAPVASIGRIPIDEGNRVGYCLDEYREQGYIPESEYTKEHNLHIPILSNLFGEEQ